MTLVQAWITDLQRALEGEALTLGVVRIGVFYTAAQAASASQPATGSATSSNASSGVKNRFTVSGSR
jgi:hypothetical protein